MIKVSDYDFDLPNDLIAREPSEPRDNCRLFVYDIKKDKITFDYFYNLHQYLPKNSFLVLNDTKVLPSRVIMYKQSGGKVEVLFLVGEIASDSDLHRSPRNDNGGNIVPVIVDRNINVGEKLSFHSLSSRARIRQLAETSREISFSRRMERDFSISVGMTTFDDLEVIKQKDNIFYLKYNFSKENLFELLKKYGTMPIPPYIKKSPLSEKQLREKYQTIFARKDGSAAAPTASLHFTNNVFENLKKKGIEKYFVTLNVGLGTFEHIGENEIINKKLHNEFWEIDPNTANSINISKINNHDLIAVGTTVVRTLESAGEVNGKLIKTHGQTDLFIYPPYNFKVIDGMITNFHLPESSLIMLVDAFLIYKNSKKGAIDLYKIAIKEKFKFYSFGDAMVIV